MSRYGRQYRQNRAIVLISARFRCQMTPGCDRRATTADHIVPYRLGGTDDVENLRAACHKCNFGGGAKLTNAIAPRKSLGASRRW